MFLLTLIKRHGELLFELSKRDVLEKYAGQALGPIWAIAHPLFLMAVYILVFGFIFGLRLGAEMPHDYGVYLLAGLIPWLGVVEVLNRSATVLTGNSALIKQVVFPVEVLPVKTVFGVVFTQCVFWFFYLLYVFASSGYLSPMTLLLPFIMLSQVACMIGIACMVSVAAAVVKDIKELIQFLSVVGLYFLPIIYLPGMVPSWMIGVLNLNPLSHMIWVYQDVVFYGGFEHPLSWGVWLAFSGLMYGLGTFSFEKVKSMLANFV